MARLPLSLRAVSPSGDPVPEAQAGDCTQDCSGQTGVRPPSRWQLGCVCWASKWVEAEAVE